eukprot:CAMPEP_0184490314 /NCGR_PEP_ID=MMETSP0113_2-20130426/17540_1 /TAXON_ID=91329 /ORGANISM="Norrisiella sphaerica, Strain BC52" /LENGTH=443 /DNA_ID=CAMNT_0026874127 /DNA_START=1879 /DNA_END=3210 /DNA_ORIENTATION=-
MRKAGSTPVKKRYIDLVAVITDMLRARLGDTKVERNIIEKLESYRGSADLVDYLARIVEQLEENPSPQARNDEHERKSTQITPSYKKPISTNPPESKAENFCNLKREGKDFQKALAAVEDNQNGALRNDPTKIHQVTTLLLRLCAEISRHSQLKKNRLQVQGHIHKNDSFGLKMGSEIFSVSNLPRLSSLDTRFDAEVEASSEPESKVCSTPAGRAEMALSQLSANELILKNRAMIKRTKSSNLDSNSNNICASPLNTAQGILPNVRQKKRAYHIGHSSPHVLGIQNLVRVPKTSIGRDTSKRQLHDGAKNRLKRTTSRSPSSLSRRETKEAKIVIPSQVVKKTNKTTMNKARVRGTRASVEEDCMSSRTSDTSLRPHGTPSKTDTCPTLNLESKNQLGGFMCSPALANVANETPSFTQIRPNLVAKVANELSSHDSSQRQRE